VSRLTDLEVLRDWATSCASNVGTDRLERKLWNQIASEVEAHLAVTSEAAPGSATLDIFNSDVR
jgi:hypothetical protein